MSTEHEIQADTKVIMDTLATRYPGRELVTIDSNKMAYYAAEEAGYVRGEVTMVSERGYEREDGSRFKRWFFVVNASYERPGIDLSE